MITQLALGTRVAKDAMFRTLDRRTRKPVYGAFRSSVPSPQSAISVLAFRVPSASAGCPWRLRISDWGRVTYFPDPSFRLPLPRVPSGCGIPSCTLTPALSPIGGISANFGTKSVVAVRVEPVETRIPVRPSTSSGRTAIEMDAMLAHMPIGGEGRVGGTKGVASFHYICKGQ